MKKAAKSRTSAKLTIADVSKIICALPGVTEQSGARGTGWKANGKLLAFTATNKSAEPDTLGVRVDNAERDRLIAAQPDIYYVADHYLNYSTVLVRLGKISRDELRNLLGVAAIAMASKPRTKKK